MASSSDLFVEKKLKKLIDQLLIPHIHEPLTRKLLDSIEETVFTKCGVAIGLVPTQDDMFVTWEGPAGTRYHIHWG